MTQPLNGLGALFVGGPADGKREYIARRPDGSPPPEIRILGEAPPLSYAEAPTVDDLVPTPEGAYVCTGRRENGPDLEARYEWRGWQ